VAWGDVVVEHMVVCDVSVMFYGRFVYQWIEAGIERDWRGTFDWKLERTDLEVEILIFLFRFECSKVEFWSKRMYSKIESYTAFHVPFGRETVDKLNSAVDSESFQAPTSSGFILIYCLAKTKLKLIRNLPFFHGSSRK
jgi:hypothetical protein